MKNSNTYLKIWKSEMKSICSLIFVMIMICLSGCDEFFSENQWVKEQAVTFEQEIAYRQRKEIELENKIKKQQEEISSLRKQLECREVKEQ